MKLTKYKLDYETDDLFEAPLHQINTAPRSIHVQIAKPTLRKGVTSVAFIGLLGARVWGVWGTAGSDKVTQRSARKPAKNDRTRT